MSNFWKSFAGGFAGKLCASLLIALCAFIGFGPDEWVKIIMLDLYDIISPDHARNAFFILGGLTLFSMMKPLRLLNLGKKDPYDFEVVSVLMYLEQESVQGQYLRGVTSSEMKYRELSEALMNKMKSGELIAFGIKIDDTEREKIKEQDLIGARFGFLMIRNRFQKDIPGSGAELKGTYLERIPDKEDEIPTLKIDGKSNVLYKGVYFSKEQIMKAFPEKS